MSHHYAMTVKKTRKPITKQHYLDYLDYLSDYGNIGNLYFETTRGLHVHFTFKTEERLDYNKLKPSKYGWNAKAIPIYNKAGWKKYCRKDYDENLVLNEQDIYPSSDDELIEDPTLMGRLNMRLV